MSDSVRVTMSVGVTPEDAFEVFTQEIDAWWRQGRRFRTGEGSVMAFDDGRLIERQAGGQTRVIGHVLAWDPPRRLSFEWRGINFAEDERTEVEVTFTATQGGTEVVLVHRGWAHVRGDHPVRHGQTTTEFLRTLGLWWGDLLGACRQRAKLGARGGVPR